MAELCPFCWQPADKDALNVHEHKHITSHIHKQHIECLKVWVEASGCLSCVQCTRPITEAALLRIGASPSHEKAVEIFANAILHGTAADLRFLFGQYELALTYAEDALSKLYLSDDTEMYAPTVQNINVLRVLLDYGISALHSRGVLLNIAIRANSADFVEYLVSNGAKVIANDSFCLAVACYFERYDIAQLLIRFGADVNGNSGLALRSADRNRDLKMMRLLINNGATMLLNSGGGLRRTKSFHCLSELVAMEMG